MIHHVSPLLKIPLAADPFIFFPIISSLVWCKNSGLSASFSQVPAACQRGHRGVGRALGRSKRDLLGSPTGWGSPMTKRKAPDVNNGWIAFWKMLKGTRWTPWMLGVSILDMVSGMASSRLAMSWDIGAKKQPCILGSEWSTQEIGWNLKKINVVCPQVPIWDPHLDTKL